MRKKLRSGKFASPIQTKRWIKCLNDWAQLKNKSQGDVLRLVGYANRSSWYRLRDGAAKRVRLDVIERTVKEADLDLNYINGLFDFKSKFSEVRNIFNDFRDAYYDLISQGHRYQASQIVRKAALFLYESLVPKDMMLRLELVNRCNEYDTASLICSVDEIEFFIINIFGGTQCVQFNMSKKVGSADIPIMEGDLDIHAVSSIKSQFSHKKTAATKNKIKIDKFNAHAKKMTETSLNL
jgi:hypothetical protein